MKYTSFVFFTTTFLTCSVALADRVITVSGVNGVYSAEARFTFDDVANTVRIRISNTMAPAADNAGARDLAGLFWDFSGVGTLTDNGAVTSADGGRPFGNGTHAYDATQMWAFRNDLPGSSPGGAAYGLGAAGFGLFNSADMLAAGGPHPQPDGPDGTIISPTGAPFSLNNPREQYRSWVEFEFGVAPSFFANGLNAIGVSNVSAQFDTTLSGPNVTLVPLPPAAWAGIASLAGIGAFSYVRRRSMQS